MISLWWFVGGYLVIGASLLIWFSVASTLAHEEDNILFWPFAICWFLLAWPIMFATVSVEVFSKKDEEDDEGGEW